MGDYMFGKFSRFGKRHAANLAGNNSKNGNSNNNNDSTNSKNKNNINSNNINNNNNNNTINKKDAGDNQKGFYKNKPVNNLMLSNSLEKNISLFEDIFSGDETLIIRRFQNRYLTSVKCCALYFHGMVNNEIINENIIQPLLSSNLAEGIDTNNLIDELQYKVIICGNVKTSQDFTAIVNSLIGGDTILLLESCSKALIISSKGLEKRSITEPESAKVIRGPREGFTESIITNISLVRRIINNADLKLKFKEIGERTHTKTCICYIEGLALESVLNELEQRLDKIKIDGILDSGYIQELIKDAPFSLFETVGASERPDVIAAKLLEGRVALFVDGSPFVLTVPYVIAESAQANEDYYNNFIFASMNRVFRTVGTILATSIPSLFLALTTFHHELLPTQLLLSLSTARKDVPLPSVLSLIIMLTIFDILREAGTRMPSSIGETINIVGTLVLGEAAVQAKLVSAPVIIVTAITGILTLMNKNLILSTVVLRFLFLIASSILGIYGFTFAFILLIIHLMSIRSFGVPYMLDITSIKDHNAQDTWIRAPWWTMTLRPKIIGMKNRIRQSSGRPWRK